MHFPVHLKEEVMFDMEARAQGKEYMNMAYLATSVFLRNNTSHRHCLFAFATDSIDAMSKKGIPCT